MSKTIKKIFKIFVIVILVIIILPISAFYIIQYNNNVQTSISSILTNNLGERLSTVVSLDKVEAKLFNRVFIYDLYIEDQSGDTLLFAKEAKLTVKRFSQKKHIIAFNKLSFKNALINLKNDSLNQLNLRFILDEFGKKDTVSQKNWIFNINNIEILNSAFTYKSFDEKNRTKGINFNNIALHDLNIDIKNLYVGNDSLYFRLKNLSFYEKSGFKLEKLNAKATINKSSIDLYGLSIKTVASKINSDYTKFQFSSMEDFKDFISLVNIVTSLQKSRIAFSDLIYFSPGLIALNTEIDISGSINGTLSNLKGKDVLVEFGELSKLDLDFGISGLPDIKKSFIYLNVNQLILSPDDIDELKIPISNEKTLILGSKIKELGVIEYNGNFTGFYDDFVAYGNLSTDLGYLSTDISLLPDTGKYLEFNGKVSTNNFNIGRVLDLEEIMGTTDVKLSVNGYAGDGGKIGAEIMGEINNLEANRYRYKNITLNGHLSEKAFDGEIIISDSNIDLSFSGNVDFSKTIPEFNFIARSPHIDLMALNLDSSGTGSELSFNLEANIIGNNLDNLLGEVTVYQANIKRDDKYLEIDTLNIKASKNTEGKTLTIKNDYFDAEITGRYLFSKIVSSLKSGIYPYFPALFGDSCDFSFYRDTINNFAYTIHLKNLQPVTNVFYPELFIAENSILSGKYNPENNMVYINGNLNEVSFKNTRLLKLSMNSISNGDSAFLRLSSKKFMYGKDISITNFQVVSSGYNDSIFTNFNWNYVDTALNTGSINTVLSFEKGDFCKPKTHFFMLPSEIMLANNKWFLERAEVAIDSTSIKIIDDFKIYHDKQVFALKGNLSEKPADSLIVKFNQINIKKINNIIKLKVANFDGIAFGEAIITDVYNKPVFVLNINVDDFILNNNDLGKLSVVSNWDNKNNLLSVKASSKKGKAEYLKIDGNLFPANKTLDFKINLEYIKVSVINPILSGIFSDLRGMASGELKLTGATTKPVLSGTLDLQKASFLVNFLNTRYNFTDQIVFNNNNIELKNITIYDEKGNSAIVDGIINNEYFKNWGINLTIDADKLYCLNTNGENNRSFFGQVYSSGIFEMTGPVDNILMKISAKSEPGTVFYIPLEGEKEIAENDFITFKQDKEIYTRQLLTDNYQVNLAGVELDMDLEVTPDAEIQLIFDAKIGDIIKSRGSGNLNMEINTLGNFSIYGDYIIDRGDYLFTLQNVINKKFNVKQGSQIIFAGDPYDASLDIDASYNLKAPIYPLVSSVSLEPAQMEIYKNKRWPIECLVLMNGKLSNPEIDLDINIQDADDNTRILFTSALNKSTGIEQTSNNELNRQFLSLMVLNQFSNPNPSLDISNQGITGAFVTTSELLSNQLSNWLSQINDNWDIGFNYRYDSDISKQQMEVALSKQILNDRMIINGNVDLGLQNTVTSSIVGEFDVEYILTKSGKLRVKAFNRTKDNQIDPTTPYTQGVGLFYREEFNSLQELLNSNSLNNSKKDSVK